MWKAIEGVEIDEEKLQGYLDDWGLHGGDASHEAWIMWKRSDYKVYPFGGNNMGWFDQPWWVKEDFLTLDLVYQWHDLQKDKPSTEGLVNPMDAYGKTL